MNPRIEAAKTWVSSAGWPTLTAWYRGSELARHAVTFVVAFAAGAVIF